MLLKGTCLVTWINDAVNIAFTTCCFVMTVTIYKCEVLATDCSTCLSLQEVTRSAQYNCQWCNSRCQHNSTCGQEQTRSCPLPNIHDVSFITLQCVYLPIFVFLQHCLKNIPH